MLAKSDEQGIGATPV